MLIQLSPFIPPKLDMLVHNLYSFLGTIKFTPIPSVLDLLLRSHEPKSNSNFCKLLLFCLKKICLFFFIDPVKADFVF